MVKITTILFLLFYGFGFVSNSSKPSHYYYGSNSDSLYSEEGKIDNGPSRVIAYSDYFTNLTDNFGNNDETEATCTYVALAMLLNYYDTTLNDNIVPEGYEVKGNATSSAGTTYESDSGLPFNSVSSYYNYLRTYYKYSSLHAYLILLDKGALDNNPSNMSSTYRDEFGSNESGMYNLAYNYLSSYSLLPYCSLSLGYTNDYDEIDDIWDDICSEIISGRPVLMGFSLHAVVAYDCSTTTIYYHNGYKTSSSHATRLGLINKSTFKGQMLQEMQRFGYLSLNFSYSHSHSYNYHDNNGDYCICGTYLTHTHSYTYNYVDYNAVYHKSYCSCGAFILEKHDYLIPGQTWMQYCSCGRHK